MLLEQIEETVEYLKKQGMGDARLGIVLGTGLGKLVDHIEVVKEIPYTHIPNFPIATVEFHSGKLIYGTLEGVKVLAMQGRFHYYEGYSMQQVTFPIRVMKALNVEHLLISNAAGSMNPNMKKGDLMLLDDHINLQPENPLVGKNYDQLGPRFPDMSEPYSNHMNALLEGVAAEKQLDLKKGVYVAVSGPNLETRAEYRYLRTIGADVVGMSTVPEVIVAKHMDLPCAAISVVTDECDPDNLKPINIEEIIAVAGKAELKLIELMRAFIPKLYA